MKIGDKVITKQTGLPASGTVVGIMIAPIYSAKMGSDYTRWSELYPDWIDKEVVFVAFEKPQKPMTMQEYVESFSDEFRESVPSEHFEVLYKYNIPDAKFVAYPIDDLEILE